MGEVSWGAKGTKGAAGAILAVLSTGLTLPDLASSALAAPAKSGTGPVGKATPIPTYQIEALTTTGMGAMAMGGGNMVRMMLGGRPALGTTTSRSLELRLDSPQVVTAPTAEHRIPAALAMGTALPLQSTSLGKGEPPTWKEQELVEGKGRMLLFRGCAESAGADQPEIVSMKGWTAEQKSQAMAAMKAMAFTVDASGTSGRWPPTTESPPIPARASLVGDHTVVSTYAPEIRFAVSSSHDFLAPLALKSETGAAGAQRLSWQGVPTALGYQAMATGMGQQEGDIVMWTSSEGPRNDSWVPSDLRAPEAARLIQRRVLLGPERTSCAISAQAMAAMKGGAMVTVTAYGDTLQISSPKGAPAWQLSLERRSSATRPVGAGMEMLEGGGAGGQQEPPKRRGFNPLQLF